MSDTEVKEPVLSMKNRFTPDQVAEIRKLRAEVDEEGKPVWTHMKLALKYETSAGRISQIVRNITYTDPEYKPVNDTAAK